MAKYDVFISYSRKDSDVVNLVASRLKKKGLSVWIDEDGIESGDLFKKVITNAIENSSCLLFFSSVNSNSSPWTAKEIGIAIYEGIPVIPVLLDDTKYNPEIKFDLVNRDFVRMDEPDNIKRSISKVVKSIRKHISKYDSKNYESIDESYSDDVPQKESASRVDIASYDYGSADYNESVCHESDDFIAATEIEEEISIDDFDDVTEIDSAYTYTILEESASGSMDYDSYANLISVNDIAESSENVAYEEYTLGRSLFDRSQYELALEHFEKASSNGIAPATYMIGYLYWYGLGVKENIQLAMYYFNKAADLGDETAKEFILNY